MKPSLESWSFQPESARIRIPPDAAGLEFIGEPPISPQPPAKSAEAQAMEPTPAPPASQPEPAAGLPGWSLAAWDWAYAWVEWGIEAWPGVASGIRDLPVEVSLGAAVLALLLLVLVTRRRRVVILARGKKTTPPDGEQKASAESPAAVQDGGQEVQPASAGKDDLLRRGAELIRAGDVEGGIGYLRKILEEEPDNPRAWMWMGWAAVRQNDPRTAERCFRTADRLGHPKAKEALTWLNR